MNVVRTVFYAWQSDLPERTNRYFIRDALRDSLKRLNKDAEIEEPTRTALTLDHDTKGEAGSPNIPQAILDKIDKCDVFVCDVSITNADQVAIIDALKATKQSTGGLRIAGLRKCPNPNVLFELGYAVKKLGWNRVICVVNDAYGTPEELPFDIEKHRVTRYSCKASDRPDKRKERRKQLELSLRLAVSSIEVERKDINKSDDDFRRNSLVARQVSGAMTKLNAIVLRMFLSKADPTLDAGEVFRALREEEDASSSIDDVMAALSKANIHEPSNLTLHDQVQPWYVAMSRACAELASELENVLQKYSATGDPELIEAIDKLKGSAFAEAHWYGLQGRDQFTEITKPRIPQHLLEQRRYLFDAIALVHRRARAYTER